MSLIEEADHQVYERYLNKAARAQSFGLHVEMSVEELAELMYSREVEDVSIPESK